MKRPRKQDPPTADRIVRAATPLFYRRGLAAVTLADIAANAGLTKRTLYYHFATKDDLVVAYLRAWRDRTARSFVDDAHADGAHTLLAAFERLEQEVATEGYRGCPFVNAVAELNDRSHPATILAASYKQARRVWFERLLQKDAFADAAAVSEQVMALWEGAMVRALVDGNAKPVRHARDAVHALLRAHRGTTAANRV